MSAIRDGVKTDQSRFHALVGIIEGFRHLESEVQILRESLRRSKFAAKQYSGQYTNYVFFI